MKKIYSSVILCLCVSLAIGQNSWSSIANFGGGERERAVSCVIGSRAYVGTGIDSANVCKTDWWEYDPGSNSWTQKANVPGTPRRDAIAFSIGNRGYVGTGINGIIAYLGSKKKDFYEYNPITNSWTTKDDWEGNFGGGVYYASAFAIDNIGYLVCGKLGPSYYSNELWRYDPATDDWVKMANVPGGTRYGVTAFSMNGKGYVGCGADEDYFRNDFYEYDPIANAWNAKADFPGSPRFNAVGLSISGRGFIGLGTDGGYQKDFYEYDPVDDEWMQKADFPASERRSCVAFTIGDFGYVGTGKGISGIKRSMFKYKPFFFFKDDSDEFAKLTATVSPNPVKSQATINIEQPYDGNCSFTVFDNQGKAVWQESGVNLSDFTFDRNNLSNGIYFYEIEVVNQTERKRVTGKLFLI